MSTKELLDAIENKDYASANQLFKAELAERISNKFEDMKVDIAQKIYSESTELEEDAEELEELSKKTLDSYANKAQKDLAVKSGLHDRVVKKRHIKYGNDPSSPSDYEYKLKNKITKRTKGIDRAIDRLTK